MSVFFVRQNENSKVCYQKHWLILLKGANLSKRKTKVGNSRPNCLFSCLHLANVQTAEEERKDEEDHLQSNETHGLINNVHIVTHMKFFVCFWHLAIQ